GGLEMAAGRRQPPSRRNQRRARRQTLRSSRAARRRAPKQASHQGATYKDMASRPPRRPRLPRQHRRGRSRSRNSRSSAPRPIPRKRDVAGGISAEPTTNNAWRRLPFISLIRSLPPWARRHLRAAGAPRPPPVRRTPPLQPPPLPPPPPLPRAP